MVLTEGYDCPDVDCVVIARPTKNIGLYLQMCGRGLRPSSGKEFCLVLDHADCTRRHGFAEDPIEWTLDPDKKAGRNTATRKDEDHKHRIMECPRCSTLMTSGQPCPSCGFKPARQPKALVTEDGELGLLDRKSRKAKAHEATIEEKRDFYAQLLGYCEVHNNNPNSAYYRYRDKFGTAPPNGWKNTIQPKMPTLSVERWVRSQNIRWAKSQQGRSAAA